MDAALRNQHWNQSTDEYKVFVMSDNGSERQNLSRRAKEDGPPVWSPDGTLIAFAGAVLN
jgi:Tol biopolymer transport system component